jgi:hypothetical protein
MRLPMRRALNARALSALAGTVAAACLALSAAPAAEGAFECEPAEENFGLCNLDVTFTNEKGEILSQAGAHPFAMTTSFGVNGEETAEGGVLANEAVRNLLFTQMPGFAATPTSVPICSMADFLTQGPTSGPNCPDSTAIGTVANRLATEKAEGALYSPVYNVETSPGEAARLGFWTTAIPITVDANLSEASPNLIVAGPTNISQLVEVAGSVFTLWGVPADPAHDPLRGACIAIEGGSTGKECPAGVAVKPFITMPRNCDGPLPTTYDALSWVGSTDRGQALSHDEAGNPQGMVGCGSLSFSPSISAVPSSRSTASPSGMDISLHLDNEGLTNPSGLAGSDIRKTALTFPAGVTINPSQAEGLATCSKAQLDRETAGSDFGAGCPAESKIGSVEVQSPLLEGETLKGSLFVATPYSKPFEKSLITLYMTVKDPAKGVGITLAGKVEPDPATGQLITTFGEAESPIPQAPISDLRVHLREGARSPLITPNLCGDYETEMLLTPTADPTHPFTATSAFHIGSGVGGGPCPPAGTPPFEPGFSAGTLTNGAATHSPFLARLTRRDGDQDLTKFSTTLPPGMLASLVGVAKCSDAAIAEARGRTGPDGGREELADPSCRADSKIGATLAGAGVGSQLTYVPGSLYLAGPYNGAPLSVVAITPGVAGPFDVGTIVVRVALGFNARTAQAEADGSRSDPIPHILRGIPLAVRDLRVNVDRPNWIFNPTSCRESAAKATIFGSAANLFDPADDGPVSRSARFQAADCLALPFGPRLDLKLKGGTSRGDHPALTATYKARKGDANLRDLSLLFPRSAFVENANFRTICTRKEFSANHCPKGSIYGHVTAHTPLLEEALSGPVYLRSSNHPLPDAVLTLHGIVDLEVPIRIDSFKQRLRATVKNAPDAPVSKVVVRMQGGSKGLFVNSRDLCAGKNRAQLDLTAHSTKKLRLNPPVKPGGCKAPGKNKRSRD